MLSFESEALSANLIAAIGQTVIRFSCDRLRLNGKNFQFTSWNDVEKKLQELTSPIHSLYVTAIDEGHFMIAKPFRGEFLGVSWAQPEFLESELDFIESFLVEHSRFHAGLTLPSDDWVLGNSVEDSARASTPCRMTPAQSMWLGVGWKNWYGPRVRSILDFGRLKSFLPAFETKELQNGALSVTLTPHYDDPDLATLQTRYWIESGLADLEKEALKPRKAEEVIKDRRPSNPPERSKPVTSLLDDIKKASEWIAMALNSSGYVADFSMESLGEIDRFFSENSNNGKAIPGGLLSASLGSRLFAIGSYLGEVLRRLNDAKWEVEDDDPEGEMNVRIVFKNGGIAWPVKRVMKRFQNGPDDGILGYAMALTEYAEK